VIAVRAGKRRDDARIGLGAADAFTGLATAWLRGVVDPLLPAGDWHGMLSGLFVVVTWPSLTWSLRMSAVVETRSSISPLPTPPAD
jgi:hypothetical protein